MTVLLVTYDLLSPGQRHTQLLEAIREFPWARLSESSYAIKTDRTPEAIYNYLAKYLDRNDKLLVITLTYPYYGLIANDVHDWLSKNLT